MRALIAKGRPFMVNVAVGVHAVSIGLAMATAYETMQDGEMAGRILTPFGKAIGLSVFPVAAGLVFPTCVVICGATVLVMRSAEWIRVRVQ
jgi:hypothetical protein